MRPCLSCSTARCAPAVRLASGAHALTPARSMTHTCRSTPHRNPSPGATVANRTPPDSRSAGAGAPLLPHTATCPDAFTAAVTEAPQAISSHPALVGRPPTAPFASLPQHSTVPEAGPPPPSRSAHACASPEQTALYGPGHVGDGATLGSQEEEEGAITYARPCMMGSVSDPTHTTSRAPVRRHVKYPRAPTLKRSGEPSTAGHDASAAASANTSRGARAR